MGQSRRFWHLRGMSGQGVISEVAVVPFLPVEGIRLDVIQPTKLEPRITFTDFGTGRRHQSGDPIR
jgi:hypothetical protein